MNKIIVLLDEHEEIADEGIELLNNRGYELHFPKDSDELLTNQVLKSSKAILVRGAIIDRKIIKSMSSLKVIARCGVGTDNIDIETATEQGVTVCNVPDANFNSVAEHVMGMILSLSHQIVNGNKAIRRGQFVARHRYMGKEIAGKTIGIIGFGRIGQVLAHKCVYGFDMNVLAYDPYVTESEIVGVQLVSSTEEIYKNADFISLHLPYIPSLYHFIGERELTKMKKTAYLVNCARGGLIDEIALAHAIKDGEIAGAGVDVFEHEPPETNHEFWGMEEVIVTPHMAASTHESLIGMAVGGAKEIISVLDNQRPRYSLN